MIKNNITKKNIINHLNSKTGFSKRFCNKIINDFINIIIINICNDEFSLKNIGTFKKVSKIKEQEEIQKQKKNSLLHLETL